MSGPVTVSVVVPALNAAATIGDMLAGLAGQAGVVGEHETIVVDGGSDDGTREIVERSGATLLIEPKRGPAAARNLGLRQAKGAVVCHLDADAYPTRYWLRELIEPFAHTEVVLVAGKTVSFPAGNAVQRYMASSGRIDAIDYIRRPVFPFVPSRNMAVRRHAALAIGGWAEECITGEDVDFCHRLLAHYPMPIVYREKALLLHRNRDTDDALCKQAWSYGEGTAHLYERYPTEVHWSLLDHLKVGAKLAARAIKPNALRLGCAIGLADRERIELAHYDWRWSLSFWSGFYSYRRTREYR